MRSNQRFVTARQYDQKEKCKNKRNSLHDKLFLKILIKNIPKFLECQDFVKF